MTPGPSFSGVSAEECSQATVWRQRTGPILGERQLSTRAKASPWSGAAMVGGSPHTGGRKGRELWRIAASLTPTAKKERAWRERGLTGAHSGCTLCITREPNLKLWKIVREDHGGYDTFDEAVVAANTEKEARYTHPNGYQIWLPEAGWVRTGNLSPSNDGTWTVPEKVSAVQIGVAGDEEERGVIVASFNAG